VSRRPAASAEDKAAIHAEIERCLAEIRETRERHTAELDELMARHERILSTIPGYPWAPPLTAGGKKSAR
jgi:hypothetical protein